jgi:hypothetical protein
MNDRLTEHCGTADANIIAHPTTFGPKAPMLPSSFGVRRNALLTVWSRFYGKSRRRRSVLPSDDSSSLESTPGRPDLTSGMQAYLAKTPSATLRSPPGGKERDEGTGGTNLHKCHHGLQRPPGRLGGDAELGAGQGGVRRTGFRRRPRVNDRSGLGSRAGGMGCFVLTFCLATRRRVKSGVTRQPG